MEKTHLTVGEIAALLSIPVWRVRRIVDDLGVDIPRAGAYRLIPCDLVPAIETRCGQGGAGPSTRRPAA